MDIPTILAQTVTEISINELVKYLGLPGIVAGVLGFWLRMERGERIDKEAKWEIERKEYLSNLKDMYERQEKMTTAAFATTTSIRDAFAAMRGQPPGRDL